jgi:hypothetical protein
MRGSRILTVLLMLTTTVVGSRSHAYDDTGSSVAVNRSAFYTQPMGYSIWKPPPRSVAQFADLLEQRRLNASPEQYAESLHAAGWIARADPATAAAYLRGLQPGTIREGKTYRLGRIIRSYRNGQGVVDANFYQLVRAGEVGYFDADGELVIRESCLNVVYPDRRAAAAAPPPASQDSAEPPPAPPPPNAEEQPPGFYDPPLPPYLPPAREAQEPASPSAP